MGNDKIQRHAHLPWLDVIRFFAAFAVVGVHVRSEMFMTYSELVPESQNLFTKILFFINSFGVQGVLVFFILSGFLVGGRSVERMIKRQAVLKDYIIDRSVRIGMPLLASLILIWGVDLVMPYLTVSQGLPWGITNTHGFKEFAGNFFGLQGVLVGDAGGTFWTLAYEIWFYVLIGSIMAITLKTHSSKTIASGCISLVLTFFVYSELTFNWISILMMGILSYYLSKIGIKKIVFFIALFVGLMLFVSINFAAGTKVEGRLTLDVPIPTLEILLGIATAVCVAYAVNHPPKSNFAILINRLGTWLASFSYSLYITSSGAIKILPLLLKY